MRKILFILFSAFALTSFAEDTDAVYVWVDGSQTCYQLEQTPKVTYKTEQDQLYALIHVSGQVVLTLPLKDQSNVVITYGKYISPSSVEDIHSTASTVKKEGKFIKGGKLIIIKGNKQYNIDGTEIR